MRRRHLRASSPSARGRSPSSRCRACCHLTSPAVSLLLRPDSTGVEPLAVPPQMAERAARHLQEHWRDGKLELGSTYAYGYNEYGKTLTEHNKKQQQLETLLLSHSLLPQTRRCVPGFKEIEDYLASYLQVGSHVAAVPALTLRPCPDPTSLP